MILSRVDLDAGSREKGRPPDLTSAAQVEDGEVVDERSMVVQYIISLLARSSKIRISKISSSKNFHRLDTQNRVDQIER